MNRYDIAIIGATIAIAFIGATIIGRSFDKDPPPQEEPVAMPPALQAAIAQQQAEHNDKVRGVGMSARNMCFLFEQGRQNCIPTITVADGGVTHDPVLPCEIAIAKACKEKYGWTP